jgi:hypothetical protein
VSCNVQLNSATYHTSTINMFTHLPCKSLHHFFLKKKKRCIWFFLEHFSSSFWKFQECFPQQSKFSFSILLSSNFFRIKKSSLFGHIVWWRQLLLFFCFLRTCHLPARESKRIPSTDPHSQINCIMTPRTVVPNPTTGRNQNINKNEVKLRQFFVFKGLKAYNFERQQACSSAPAEHLHGLENIQQVKSHV